MLEMPFYFFLFTHTAGKADPPKAKEAEPKKAKGRAKKKSTDLEL